MLEYSQTQTELERSGYMSVSIIEENSRGVWEISLESELFAKRKLFLGDITRQSAEDFTKAMMYLSRSSEPISIFINSRGGEVDSGLLICDLVQSIDVPVNMYCTGCAYSIAAIILAAGTKGRRFILPHSRVLVHEPLLAGGVSGSATSISMISDTIIEMRNVINDLLVVHTGKTREEINKATAFDNLMNAEKAVEFGICDKIVRSIF